MSKPWDNIPQALIPFYVAQIQFARNNAGKRADHTQMLTPPHQHPDNDTQKIFSALENQEYRRAYSLISHCKNVVQARLIFGKVLAAPSAQCRYAFIRNHQLNDELTSHDIYLLLMRCDQALNLAQPHTKRFKCLVKIGLYIAKTPELARRLGYQTFLKFTEKNKALEDYIVKDEKFLMSLDPLAVKTLFKKSPESRLEIIRTLKKVFDKYPETARENILASQILDRLENSNDDVVSKHKRKGLN